MKQLNILQLLPNLNSGGVERGTLEVSKAIVDAGHKSFVISGGGRLVAQLQEQGGHHTCMPIGLKSLKVFFLILKLRQYLLSNSIDIVHVRSRLPAWVLHFTLKTIPQKNRPARLSTVHGLYSVSRYSAIMTQGEKVIAVSQCVKEYIKANYTDCDPNKISVIPRGISENEFPYGYKATTSWRESFFRQFPELEKKIILTLPGRITRLKGHYDFLDLVQALTHKGMPVHGLIVGGHEPQKLNYLNELKKLIRNKKLGSHITFTGHRSDIKEIYSISRIVFSLSHKPESFGRTVLEPLSLGVSTIGYSHGGVKEIFEELYPDGLVNTQCIESLIKKTQETLESTIKPRKNTSFTLLKMLKKTLDLYIEISAISKK